MKSCKYCNEKNVRISSVDLGTWKDPFKKGFYVRCPYCKDRGPILKTQVDAIRCWDGDDFVNSGKWLEEKQKEVKIS